MRKSIAVAAALALCAVLAWFLSSSHSRAPSERVVVSSAAARYALAYESTEERTQGLTGSLGLDAEIELRAYDAHRVGLEVVSCDRIAWRVLEAPVMESADECDAEVVGREVLLDLDAHRGLRAVDVPPDLTPRAEHLLRGLAQELSFEQRDDRSWTSEEQTPRGTASAQYERDGDAIVRTRGRYTEGPAGSVEGRTRFVADGLLPAELHLEERIESDAHIVVRLDLARGRTLAAAHAPSIDGWTRWIPGAPSAQTSTALLDQRVDGYTREALLGDLDRFADGGELPEHERTVWRATGLLRLHPELARELEPRFLDPSATDRRRGLLLDLLASAGTREAQASMRRLLESSAATERSDRYAYYVQRLGLVGTPDEETLAWIEAHHAAATEHNGRFATAFALGSVARERGRTDPEVPGRVARELSRLFDNASDDRERSLWLRAVGATGDPSAEPALSRGLASSSPSVRLSAVEGYARLGSQAPLREAVADAHPAVQALAIRHVAMDDEGARALDVAISAHGVDDRNVQSLVRRLAQEAEAHPESVARVARAMIENGYASGTEAATLHRLAG